MKTKKAFILYEYDSFKNDYIQVFEYYNLKELQEKENIKLKNKKSIYNYIYNNIDSVYKENNKLFNKYIIIKEDIY